MIVAAFFIDKTYSNFIEGKKKYNLVMVLMIVVVVNVLMEMIMVITEIIITIV